jgi:hypothetical protein
MKHKKEITSTVPDLLSEYSKLLDSARLHNEDIEMLKKKLADKYTYQAEPKTTPFFTYESARGEGKSMSSYSELLGINCTLFGNYVRDRENSLKEQYVLEIVGCFTKAFEEVYSNECPKELLDLCKQYVVNFVKSLDSSTKM